MLRRLLVTSIRRSFVVLLLICLGCVAQSAPSDLSRKIERQVRSNYSIPSEVNITVGPMTASTDWPNYDSVTVTIGDEPGKKSDYKFLVSKDRNTMLRMVKFDLSKDPFAETMSKIDITGRPTRGAKSAKVLVVNFDDFECPFCSRMHATLFPEIFKEYGDRVTFIYKDYPLVDIHPWATHAAVDANCLAAQNGDTYWTFVDYLHSHGEEVNGSDRDLKKSFEALDRIARQEGTLAKLDSAKLDACIAKQDESQVRTSAHEAESLGIEGTPAMFINGERIPGALPEAQLWIVIDRALRAAGVQPPAAQPEAPAAQKPSGAGK
jgi:protein-disulfide isomerase